MIFLLTVVHEPSIISTGLVESFFLIFDHLIIISYIVDQLSCWLVCQGLKSWQRCRFSKFLKYRSISPSSSSKRSIPYRDIFLSLIHWRLVIIVEVLTFKAAAEKASIPLGFQRRCSSTVSTIFSYQLFMDDVWYLLLRNMPKHSNFLFFMIIISTRSVYLVALVLCLHYHSTKFAASTCVPTTRRSSPFYRWRPSSYFVPVFRHHTIGPRHINYRTLIFS